LSGADETGKRRTELATLPVARARRPDPDEEENLVGRIIEGRYQLTELIAEGTMGRVYLGVQLRLERPVAIKIMRQSGILADERFAKRFCREASIASQLTHPNIVSVFDYGETEDGKLFMVMEYLEGEPLSEILERHAPLPAERALAIAIQIARALRRAHDAGVVHRDLKPANVIVSTDEEGFDFVKVLDFGLVKLFARDASEVSSPFSDDELTRPGNMVGTPDYVSPEQALGDEVDARTDIYALGVLLFHMIAGRLPFVGGTIVELVKQHLDAPVPEIAAVSPGVRCPPAIEALIGRAMMKLRDHRFATTDQMLEALKGAWRDLTDESYGSEIMQLPVVAPVIMEPIDDARTDDMDRAREAERLFQIELAGVTEISFSTRSRRWLKLASIVLFVAAVIAGGWRLFVGREGSSDQPIEEIVMPSQPEIDEGSETAAELDARDEAALREENEALAIEKSRAKRTAKRVRGKTAPKREGRRRPSRD
jgi:serine/threonine protein kinase